MPKATVVLPLFGGILRPCLNADLENKNERACLNYPTSIVLVNDQTINNPCIGYLKTNGNADL